MQPLGGDRTGVEERLGATGRRVRARAAEVLVVDEHVLAVGPDEVGVVDVEPVGDEPDLDAGAGVAETLRGRTVSGRLRGVDGLDGLRVQLHLAGGRAHVGEAPASAARAAAVALGQRHRGRRDQRNLRVGDDLGHGRVGREPLGLAPAHVRRHGVDELEALDVGGMSESELGHDRVLQLGHGRRPVSAERAVVRQRGELVLEHHDHAVGGVHRERPRLLRRQPGLTAGSRSGARNRNGDERRDDRCERGHDDEVPEALGVHELSVLSACDRLALDYVGSPRSETRAAYSSARGRPRRNPTRPLVRRRPGPPRGRGASASPRTRGALACARLRKKWRSCS